MYISMQTKSHYEEKIKGFVRRLSDIRFAGQVLFVLLVLLISWSGVKTIQTNYDLQKQISKLRQQNTVQKLQNTNMALQNEYLKSDQYLELSARQNFGLAAKGEKVVVVPERVALAYTTDVTVPGQQTEAAKKQPVFQKHFTSWKNFFLHRPNSGD
jgi:cell division protein FtsL